MTPTPEPWIARARDWCRRAAAGEVDSSGLRQSLLPHAIACAPLIVTSVLAPPWLSWAMALPSLLALFHVADALEPALFDVPLERGFLAYALPLNALLFFWGVGVSLAGRPGDIATTVFPYAAVLWVTIAPAVRRNRSVRARRWPLRWTFVAVASVAVALHGAAALAGEAR
jgi:hypothetical protein